MRPAPLLLWGSAAQAILLVVTALPPVSPGLGAPVWHHNATLVLSLLFVAATWRRFTSDRAFLAIGILVTTILATASGFILLYLKESFKAWGLKDWMKWWHILWSWFALWYFVAHVWINRAPLVAAWRRIHARAAPGSIHIVLLVVVVAAIPLTWSSWGARTITDANYIPLTLYTWLVFTAPPYALWLGLRIRLAGRAPRRDAWFAYGSMRRLVDVALFPATILANVSGFPLLYAGTKDTALKYVAKYWHTWPSIAFALLVAVHALHSWPELRAHWRFMGRRTA